MEEREIVVYGLSSAIELGVNILSTILLGAVFGMVVESVIFLVAFSLVRIYAGGYHAKTSGRCYWFSILGVMIILMIQKYQPINIQGYLILLFLAIPVILKLAPLEDKNKPLDHLETQVYRKRTLHFLLLELIVMAVGYIWGIQQLFQGIALSIIMVALVLLLGQ